MSFSRYKIYGTVLAILLFGPTLPYLHAGQILQVTETNISGLGWEYDIVASNPFPLASNLDLYDIVFQFSVSGSTLLLPAGWDDLVNGSFIETFSTNPGPPPIGTDVPPGASLGYFSFLFDQRLDNIPFAATFVDTASGQTTTVNGTATAVPEPQGMLLAASALTILWSRMRRRSFVRP